MSLQPQPLPPVPAETARITRAAFPKAHPYLAAADALDALFVDEQFTALYPLRGRPALAPWRLALTTILQFAEGLSDRQAADAVRARLDWKYVLRLDLADPGFDASVLSEFRGRLVSCQAEALLFETLLTWCREHKLVAARGRQRTDSTHILAAVRMLTRFEVVGETMRHALNALAVAAPRWLAAHAEATWVERYADRIVDDHLPATRARWRDHAMAIGRDGHALLAAVYAPDAPGWVRELPAVDTLRRVWVQNYRVAEDGAVDWRDDDYPPPAHFVSSPHDLDALYARKRATTWLGYKLHLTETCDSGQPRLVTHVQTMRAPTVDEDALPLVHRALEAKGLLPSVHLADAGYMAAGLLATSRRDHDVELIGPTRPNIQWQAKAGAGFAAEDFRVDWAAEQAICPQGCVSSSWTIAADGRKRGLVKIKFAKADCVPCPCRPQCTRAKDGRRTLTLRQPEEGMALALARARMGTAEFTAAYAQRAGVEGTLSLGVRVCDLRRSRYIGAEKTHLQHLLTAAAINFLRLGRWLSGTPPAKTRRTPFVRLMEELRVA